LFHPLEDEISKQEAMSRTHTAYILDSRISNPADLLQLLPFLYFICAHWDMTCCSQDGLGIESRWAEIFHTHADQPWGPTSLPYNGYPRVCGQGMVLTMPPPPNAEIRERVEMYLYSPLVH